MPVHSNDGKHAWSTKLNRIGELSASQPDIVFNNLGHLICFDMLKELYTNLDRNKAIGVDGVTKEDYGYDLTENLTGLIDRLRRGTYKPQPSRVSNIPKEDGSYRALAISCFEDKLVQLAISTILTEIYEPVFTDSSFGFRTGKGCHDAIRALNQSTFKNQFGAVVEIDIKQCFDQIPHDDLMGMLSLRISDKRFLKIIERLITSPIEKGGVIRKNDRGTPQGSIVSPVLANIYLHYVIDEWFERISQSHIKGRAEMVRYADDLVFTFQVQKEAVRFYKVLPKRLAKYGLEMHKEKSSIIPGGHYCAKRAHEQGKRLPTFKFLGFVCYWGRSRKGYWTLRFTSRKDRFATKLKGLKNFLTNNLTTRDTPATVKRFARMVAGWVNYHHISFNRRRVDSFIFASKRHLLKWFNRRGGNRKMNWSTFGRILTLINYPNASRLKVNSMF